ncbi:MAG: Glucokinase [Pseudomonadota bacterium]
MTDTFPRLLGDVGGTNARFGWQANAHSSIEHVLVLPCAAHETLEAAIRTYLEVKSLPMPRAGALGIANPITGDAIRMTNHHWSFSISEMQRSLGLQQLNVINDFTALALALPSIAKDNLVQVGGTVAQAYAPKALIGAGTGLGVSGLIPTDANDHWVAIAGEGGHVTLAAQTESEYRVIELIRQRYGHVSAERVLSGQGLVDLYLALRQLQKQQPVDVAGAAEITALALQDKDPLALQSIEMFAGFLGSVTGDLALTLGARGGVYLGGGIVPRWLGWFETSQFRERFEAKGRFKAYLKDIPVWVINAAESPALLGAARSLQ